MDVMSREQTLEFLQPHVKTEMLMKHLFAVEASMRGYARKFGGDEERWTSPGCSSTLTGRSALLLKTTQSTARRSSATRATLKTSSGRC